MSRTTRFTSVLTLTLCAALAACESPTSVAAPLSVRSAVASANGGKPDVELCQAYWQELKTWGGGSGFKSLGDCIKYNATGGIFEGTPIIWTVYQSFRCVDGAKVITLAVEYTGGTGVIDYGTGPQPYTSQQQILLDGNSPPEFTLTVTNAYGQTASLTYQTWWNGATCS